MNAHRVPAEAIETVGATAYLATRRDASEEFRKGPADCSARRGAVHGISKSDPLSSRVGHDSGAGTDTSARQYFSPPDQLGVFTNVLESLAAMKELILALTALGWLIWDRWKRLQAEERERILAAQKDFLDSFLEKTLDIESAQMRTTDPIELQQHLDKVTQIKLDALRELTHEDLRSDRAFIIFLTQCANLINKIQYKILDAHQQAWRERESTKKTAKKKVKRKTARKREV